MTSRCILFVLVAVTAVICVYSAPAPAPVPAPNPFFDAIYDAVVGNGRRTYGYNGYPGYNDYNGYGYNGGYNGYTGYAGYENGHRREEKPRRHEKSYKDICRVHFPDSIAQPGKGGIVCPY